MTASKLILIWIMGTLMISLTAHANSQKKKIDSLKQVLQDVENHSAKANVYLELSHQYYYIDPKLSFEFAVLAGELIENSTGVSSFTEGMYRFYTGDYEAASRLLKETSRRGGTEMLITLRR